MAQERGIVTASVLNVRPEPSTRKAAVGQLRRGDGVDVLARTGSWYEVRKGRLKGFVHGDWVRIQEEALASGFLHERPGLRDAPLAAPDGDRISTAGLSGRPRTVATTWNRAGGIVGPVCDHTAIARAAAVAVLQVESGGRGFGDDGRMIIRFETHVFGRQWREGADGTFAKHFRNNAVKPWTGQQFRTSPTGRWRDLHTRTSGQKMEWEAFELARSLHESSALRAISMGAPQIMGFNHAAVGYDSAGEMFERFSQDERFHVLAMFDFIVGPGTTSPMLEALRGGRYEQFATGYNGAGQAAVYGQRIREYAEAFEGL